MTVLERGPLHANCNRLYSSGGNLLQGMSLINHSFIGSNNTRAMLHQRFELQNWLKLGYTVPVCSSRGAAHAVLYTVSICPEPWLNSISWHKAPIARHGSSTEGRRVR